MFVPILLPVVEMDVRIDNAKLSACLHEILTTFQLRIGHSAAARPDHLHLECTRRSSAFARTVCPLGKYFERKLHSRVFLMDEFTASIEGCSPVLSSLENVRASGRPHFSSEGILWRSFRHCLYATNLTGQNDANDIQTDLRNMLPQAKLYYVPSQSALSIRGSSEDISLAQKILADLDRTRKTYRLTYTMTETDNGKRVTQQRFAVIVASGSKTDFKQGSKVPLVTGTSDAAAGSQSSQVQYQDVGFEIEASLNANLDGVKLRSKIAESSVADEKSGIGAQDPIFRQTTLDGTSTLTLGKPLVLGSLDIPGTTRHQEVEVVSELVR
jgi:hypothetical protein